MYPIYTKHIASCLYSPKLNSLSFLQVGCIGKRVQRAAQKCSSSSFLRATSSVKCQAQLYSTPSRTDDKDKNSEEEVVDRRRYNPMPGLKEVLFKTNDLRFPLAEGEEDEAPRLDNLYKSVTFECKGHDSAVLKAYCNFLTLACGHLEVKHDEPTFPRRFIRRRVLLKSAFVHKNARVHYEWRTYFLVFKMNLLTESTKDTVLEYFQRNMPEGVAMKVIEEIYAKFPEPVRKDIERRRAEQKLTEEKEKAEEEKIMKAEKE